MTLKIEDIKRATRELLEQYGENYVYRPTDDTGCSYGPQEDGPDGCLIGLIAKKLDAEMYAALVAADAGCEAGGLHPWFDMGLKGEDGGPVSLEERPDLAGTGIIRAEDRGIVMAMREAQCRQDAGLRWGEAAKFILEYQP